MTSCASNQWAWTKSYKLYKYMFLRMIYEDILCRIDMKILLESLKNIQKEN